jgi:hypothetical protein
MAGLGLNMNVLVPLVCPATGRQAVGMKYKSVWTERFFF